MVTPAEMQQDPNTLPPTLVQKKNTKYPHLSTKEIFLLEKGMAIYNNKEYDLALPYFIKGKHLNPKSKEFEFYTFMCQRKYDKEGNQLFLHRYTVGEQKTGQPLP